MTKISTKKRLMYLSGEDFYFYCYSVFVILNLLGCRDGKYFRDYRKLAFLTDIISDDKTVYVISNSSRKEINPKDREHLLDSYSNGLTRRSEILKLLFVKAVVNRVQLSIKNNIFDSEIKNINAISTKVSRLASLTLETMLNKVYVENGVRTWV